MLTEYLEINAVRPCGQVAARQSLLGIALEDIFVWKSLECASGDGIRFGKIPRETPGNEPLLRGRVQASLEEIVHSRHPRLRRIRNYHQGGGGDQGRSDKFVAGFDRDRAENHGQPQKSAARIRQ